MRDYTKDRTTFEVQRTLNQIAVVALRCLGRRRMLENRFSNTQPSTLRFCHCLRLCAHICIGYDGEYSNSYNNVLCVCESCSSSMVASVCVYAWSTLFDGILLLLVLLLELILCRIVSHGNSDIIENTETSKETIDQLCWHRILSDIKNVVKFHSHISIVSHRADSRENDRSTLCFVSCVPHIPSQSKQQSAVAHMCWWTICVRMWLVRACVHQTTTCFYCASLSQPIHSSCRFVCTLAYCMCNKKYQNLISTISTRTNLCSFGCLCAACSRHLTAASLYAPSRLHPLLLCRNCVLRLLVDSEFTTKILLVWMCVELCPRPVSHGRRASTICREKVQA